MPAVSWFNNMALRRRTGTLHYREAFEGVTVALEAALTSGWSDETKRVVNKIAAILTTAGVIAKADGLYLYGMLNGQSDALLNWKNPTGNFNCIPVGTPGPTFTLHRGFLAISASDSYLSTEFNPNVAVSPNISLTSAAMFIQSLTAAASSTTTADDCGNAGCAIGCRTSGNNVTTRGQNATGLTTANVGPTGKGFFGWSRVNGTGYDQYQELTATPKVQANAASFSSTKFRVGSNPGTVTSDREFSGYYFGAGLTADQVKALREAFLIMHSYRGIS